MLDVSSDVDAKVARDKLAKFLIEMLQFSDREWKGKRKSVVEKHYQKAIALLREAGFEYKSPR